MAKSSTRSKQAERSTETKDPIEKRGVLQKLADFLFGYDFFISYCWADGRIYAVELQERLETLGFNCFLDSSDYAKGDNWRAAGRRALKKTSRLILVGTPEALLSEPVANELRIFSKLNRRVFPIDFGGALAGIGSDEGLFKYLDPDMLRVLEADEALANGPSEEVLDQIRGSFNLLRQDQKRVRIMGTATLVFAMVALLAVVLGFLAHLKTREAQVNLAQSHIVTAQAFLNSSEQDLAMATHQFVDAVEAAPRGTPISHTARDLASVWMEEQVWPLRSAFRHTAGAFSADERQLVLVDVRGKANAWDVETGALLGEVPLPLLVGPENSSERATEPVLTPSFGQPYWVSDLGPKEVVRSLAFRPASNEIACGVVQGRMIEARFQEAVDVEYHEIQARQYFLGRSTSEAGADWIEKISLAESPTCLLYSPDGQWLALGSGKRTIRVFRAGGAKLEEVALKGLDENMGEGVNDLAFSEDGKTLVAGVGPSLVLFDLSNPTAKPTAWQVGKEELEGAEQEWGVHAVAVNGPHARAFLLRGSRDHPETSERRWNLDLGKAVTADLKSSNQHLSWIKDFPLSQNARVSSQGTLRTSRDGQMSFWYRALLGSTSDGRVY